MARKDETQRVRVGAPPPPSDLGFRKSLAWRLPPEVGQDLPSVLRPKASDPPSGLSFIETVFAEVAAIETRIDTLWNRRVSGPTPHRPQLDVMVDDFSVRARIEIRRGASRAGIRFAVGAALAFDDLALCALCEDMVLARDTDALRFLSTDAAGAAAVRAIGRVGAFANHETRFVDYGTGLDDIRFDRAHLTFAAPSAPWRLLQANLLSELMIAFALFHERMHFGLGHLDLLAGGGAEVLAMNEGVELKRPRRAATVPRDAGKERLPAEAYRALELNADTQAFYLMATYALMKDGPCQRFERLLRECSCEVPDFSLGRIDVAAGIRVALTAIGFACLVFDEASSRSNLVQATHPQPLARLMNLMIKAPTLLPMVRLVDGEFVLNAEDVTDPDDRDTPEFRDLVYRVFAMSLTDLQVTADLIGARLRPLDPGDDGELSPASWIADLGAFWISEHQENARTPTTAPGREIWLLRLVEANLAPRLRACQIARFGSETTVEIGGLSSSITS